MGRNKNKNSRGKFSKNNNGGSIVAESNEVDIYEENKLENILTDTEVLFERYKPKSVRVQGREFFVHSLCQVCRAEVRITGKTCPKCRLITYCSDLHRRQHWPEHAELCDAITSVCVARHTDHILQGARNMSPDTFRKFRLQALVECEARAERPLDKWEREMFIFPNLCGECHDCDKTKLVTCNHCQHSGFCKGHPSQDHDAWCELLILYKSIVKDQSKSGVVCPALPVSKLSSTSPVLSDIEGYFGKFKNCIDQLELVELTEITTYPLTALNCIQLVNKGGVFKSEKLVIHVVGAEPDFETNKIEKWEYYLLHHIPGVKSLQIEFVGPELNTAINSLTYRVCDNCQKAKKTLNFKFYNQLYHTFSERPDFSRPDLICVFNPGLYRTTGFDGQDTWRPTIASMFAKNCHILTTAYTRKEIELDLKTVQASQTIALEQEATLNPFSSLKPSLNFVSDEESPVIFKNQYYCIMKKK